jgi:hypothetical protein
MKRVSARVLSELLMEVGLREQSLMGSLGTGGRVKSSGCECEEKVEDSGERSMSRSRTVKSKTPYERNISNLRSAVTPPIFSTQRITAL